MGVNKTRTLQYQLSLDSGDSCTGIKFCMPENPSSLTNQLASRLKTFVSNLGLSQREISKILKLNESHLSRFLSGEAGLSAEMTLKVLRLTSVSRRDLALKFGKPEKTTAKIMHLSESGRALKLDGGAWVPGQSGSDSDGGSIDDVPTARDLDGADDYQAATIDFLKGQQNIHRSAIKAIQDYLDKVSKAKRNPGGSTLPARMVSDPRTPGPKNELLQVDPKEHLEYLQRERERAEEALRLEKQIKAEGERAWNARVELLRFKEGKR